MTGAAAAAGWRVEQRLGSAAELHGLDLPDGPGPAVWVLEPARPALVLGSTQDDAVADAAACARLGVDVARRRSGGGAVLLDATGRLGGPRTVWIDVAIDRSDPRWHDDVGRSMWWVGDAWAAALASLGVEAAVHRGAFARTPAAALVCFGGLGPGEVVGVAGPATGPKLVGISQRRTRAGARFQCVAAVGPTGAGPAGYEAIVDLLAAPAEHAAREELAATLRATAAVVPVEPAALVGAVVAALTAT